MKGQITATDLKVRGMTAVDEKIQDDGTVITVRGKEKYVVLPIAEYNRLREMQLEAAIQESMRDTTNGKIKSQSVEPHLRRISLSLA